MASVYVIYPPRGVWRPMPRRRRASDLAFVLKEVSTGTPQGVEAGCHVEMTGYRKLLFFFQLWSKQGLWG